MQKNIVLIGARLSDNFGGPSLAIATVELLLTAYKDACFTLLVPEEAYVKDKKLESKYPVDILPFHADKVLFYILIKRWTSFSIGSTPFKKTVTALYDADFIIDIWGIMFADSFRSTSLIPKFREGLRLVLGNILNKPFIKYTSAMGPFQSIWNRNIAKYYLNKFVHAIIARDKVTEKHLKSIGIVPPVFVAPDTAFLLQRIPISIPTYLSELFNQRKVLGISVSYQIRNRIALRKNTFLCLFLSFDMWCRIIGSMSC